MGPGEDRRVAEEQVPMPRQDAENPRPGILVKEPVDPLDHGVKCDGHRVNGVDGKTRILSGERTDLGPGPLGDLAFREGDELDARRDRCHAREPEEVARPTDAACDVHAIDGRPPKRAEPVEDHRQRWRLPLSVDGLARTHDPEPRRRCQGSNGLATAVRELACQQIAQCESVGLRRPAGTLPFYARGRRRHS